jgi:hypothetical protein
MYVHNYVRFLKYYKFCDFLLRMYTFSCKLEVLRILHKKNPQNVYFVTYFH